MKVTLLMAITLDGKIGVDSDHFPDWTEKADKALFKDYTKQAGVFVIGRKTYDTIGRPLPGRLNVVMTRVILTEEDSEMKADNLMYTKKNPKELLKDLEDRGFEEVVIAGGTTINTLFAQEKLLDEMIITISPKLFGKGLSLFDSSIALDLELLEVEKIGEQTIKARYKVL